jgi:glycosyltransferase involved in cell wall biosynthesis
VAAPHLPGVSVVLPVYNGAETLCRCLASLNAQDLPREEFDVVAVDDGSTDRSGEMLDRYARGRPNTRVIHQEASGGPGRPRNVGTDAAAGEFVFYIDADDELIPEALARILAFAREHGSDLVVVGRVTVERDKVLRPLANLRVLADAPLRMAFMSLTPHKLVRRELLVCHRIRFPEGRHAWEDGIFLSRLAPHARRISVLQDRAYYIKHREPHRLSAAFRIRSKARSAMEIVDTLRRLDADPAETDAIATGLYRRLVRIWNSKRFLRLSRHSQELDVAAMQRAGTSLFPASRDAELPLQLHLRSLAFRGGRVPVVAALASCEQEDRWSAPLHHPVLLPTLGRAALGRTRRAMSRPGIRLRPAEHARAAARLLRRARCGWRGRPRRLPP